MNGLVFWAMTKDPDVKYRNPAEAKLAKEIADSRSELADLCSLFASRLVEFRTEQDVWIEIGKHQRLGLLREIGSGLSLMLDEDGERRSLSDLELSELSPLLKHLPQLKKAVIAESFDHLGDIRAVISRFREEVLDLAGDDD